LETWEPSQHSLVETGKPRKTCVDAAGRNNVSARDMVCLGNMCVDTLHKGEFDGDDDDNDDNDNNKNNNNNNNCLMSL